jgi:hypothetical protein
MVEFIIETDGRITHAVVKKGIGCDDEVVRVIQFMPKWIQVNRVERPSACSIEFRFSLK